MNLYNLENPPNFDKLKNDNEEYKSTLVHFYNWSSENHSVKDLKNFTINYLESQKKDFSFLDNIPDYKFSLIGKIAYLLNNNYFVSLHSLESFDKKLKMFKEEKKQDIVVVNQKYTKIPYTLYDKIVDSLEDLVILGKLNQENMSDLLFDENLSYSDYQNIIKYFKDCVDEWTSSDVDCQEMQNLIDKDRKKKIINSYKLIIKFCELSLHNLKATKLNKKNKFSFSERKTLKKASKVENKKIDLTYNLVSLPPSQIIGCSVAILFNSKNKRTIVFYAKDDEKLSVKGKSIINYDETKSFSKILKNPDKDLQSIKTANNLNRINILFSDTLKGAKHKIKTPIINPHTLILKIFE